MKWKEVHYRWAGIAVVSLLLVVIAKQDMPGSFIEKYGVSFIITGFFWNGAFLMFMFYRKKFPLIRQTVKRLTITVFSLLIFLLAGDILFCSLINQVPISELFNNPAQFFHYTPFSLVISIVVGSIYENAYFFDQWKRTIQINESLKNQQIRTQFEVLQNQMSPHFLFNSLNALTTLIGEDRHLAATFTEKLSDVYRYILQNKERDIVSLREELAFVKAYMYLQQMRFPDNLTIEIDIPDHLLDLQIAPLTLQILVENSVKHNIISRNHPLHISVSADADHCLIVRNNLQRKNVLEKSTKTGLNNITRRYEYLTREKIIISEADGSYSVSVPLLELAKRTIVPEV